MKKEREKDEITEGERKTEAKERLLSDVVRELNSSFGTDIASLPGGEDRQRYFRATPVEICRADYSWAQTFGSIAVNSSAMRVLGIDCGGEYTGYGVVETNSRGTLKCLTCGAIKLSPREPLPKRLSRIYTQLGEIISEHRPDEVAIEDIFYAVNVKSALKLGQVRGVAMLAAANAGLDVAEYSPLTIKSSVVGYGRAEKQQVQHMVTHLLELTTPPEPLDASDALAIAICHLHTAGTLQRQRAVAH